MGNKTPARICTNTAKLLSHKLPEGFDPLMMDGDSMSMSTLKLCYRKHVQNDESVGWDELSDVLGNTLAQIMGDDAFCEWLEGSG
ncbi:hypothetical protein LCGC14_2738390 [marine sediment metagenome]|uniref:Uncharacterized protein n=1 Tax=marine sediment metagenome TaxID=412755 RepID=A0A0F8Z593_9ZZZZ